MKIVAPVLAVLLILLVVSITFWRIGSVNKQEEELKALVEEQWSLIFFDYTLEIGFLSLMFFGGNEKLDPLDASLDHRLKERLNFWKNMAVAPNLGESLFIVNTTTGKTASLSFETGDVTRGPDPFMTPYIEYIESLPFKESLHYFDTPVITLEGRQDKPFIAQHRQDYIYLLFLNPQVLTTDMIGLLLAGSVSENDGMGNWWNFTIEWTGPEDIQELVDDENLVAYPISAADFEEVEEAITSPLFDEIPRELRNNADLASIMIFRAKSKELDDMVPQLYSTRPSLWAIIRWDSTKLRIVALQKELGQIFVTYMGLILLIVLFVVLMVNYRHSKKQIKEQMRFVANVTHELRTPLGIICNAGSNIVDGYVANKEGIRRYGELIKTEGRRLSRMVESILLYSGLQTERRNLERISLDDFFPPLLKPVELLCSKKNIRFEKIIEPGLAVYGDKEGLHSAVTNLLFNGITHGGEGKYLRLLVCEDSDLPGISISVGDLGPGISEQEQGRIFAPFYRGSRTEFLALPGTGIGLSLVKKVAELHGGDIRVKSEPGQGSLFTLFIPTQEVL